MLSRLIEETAGRIAKIIDCVIAPGDRIFKWEGDLVEAMVQDTHAPDKVQNVSDVFLVCWFGSKDDQGAPRALAQEDPAIVE